MAVSSLPEDGAVASGHEAGWRRGRGAPSLSEVFGSIATRPQGPLWRKLIAFLGPGYLPRQVELQAKAVGVETESVAALKSVRAKAKLVTQDKLVRESEIAGGGSIGRRDQSVLILIGQSSAGQLLAGRQVGNGIRTWVLSCSSGTRLRLDRTCSGLNAGASLSASSSLGSATRGRTAAGLTVDLERGHRRAHQ